MCLLSFVFLLSLILTMSAPSDAAPPETVHFTKRPAEVGDQLDQTIGTQMLLDLRSRRGKEILEQSKVNSRRQQHRQVTATRLEAGRVVQASVHFFTASKSHNDQTIADPVVGKTYHCRRTGDQLTITTTDGQVPPLPEYKVVARAMDSLGKPNPLANFLAGKTVTVGESIELPAEVAQRTLGFDKKMGDVEKFTLTLKSIDQSIAHFDAQIEATGSGSSQMRLLIGGPLLIESGSCRVVSAKLSGPIGLAETRGSAGHIYQIEGTGSLRVSMHAKYADDRR